jgi:hypothetical protein
MEVAHSFETIFLAWYCNTVNFKRRKGLEDLDKDGMAILHAFQKNWV